MFEDIREAHISVISGGMIAPPLGGYGPWTIEPALMVSAREGFSEGKYLCTPLPMTQTELAAQYVWAMARSDRSPYRPRKIPT